VVSDDSKKRLEQGKSRLINSFQVFFLGAALNFNNLSNIRLGLTVHELGLSLDKSSLTMTDASESYLIYQNLKQDLLGYVIEEISIHAMLI